MPVVRRPKIRYRIQRSPKWIPTKPRAKTVNSQDLSIIASADGVSWFKSSGYLVD